MQRYLALSERAAPGQASGMQDVTHLIWPESVFPFFLSREPEAMAQIAALLADKAVLITGGVRAADPVPAQGRITRAYNSIYVIGRDGTILSFYDKVHLVPFGEFLPFQKFLESLGLMQLTQVPGGFLAGDRRRTLEIPGAPRALPLICYEIIFPGEAVPAGERPGWLINVTNDGWFGISPGPYQHFQQARMLAIAEGLPLVRAANTGISAVVDPLGRIVKALPLGTEGVLDSPLPQRARRTVFAHTGDTVFALMLAAALILVMRRRMRR
jgi:apolipoprotein N-acyltransferase